MLKRPINREHELHWFGICCTLLKLPQKEAFVWGWKRFGDLYAFRNIQAAFRTDPYSFFFSFWEQLLSENGKDNGFVHLRNISNPISSVFSDLLDILSVPFGLLLVNEKDVTGHNQSRCSRLCPHIESELTAHHAAKLGLMVPHSLNHLEPSLNYCPTKGCTVCAVKHSMIWVPIHNKKTWEFKWIMVY